MTIGRLFVKAGLMDSRPRFFRVTVRRWFVMVEAWFVYVDVVWRAER